MKLEFDLPDAEGDLVYQFRAECPPDVDLFMRAIFRGVRHQMQLTSEDGMHEPDVVFVVKKNTWTLPQMIWMARQITDCHVIEESLQLKQNYTGERISGREMEQPSPEMINMAIQGLERMMLTDLYTDRAGRTISKLKALI